MPADRSLDRLANAALLVPFESTTAPRWILDGLAGGIAGVCLFHNNIDLSGGPDALANVIRALPANLEAEAAFLGAVLIDNRVLEELPVSLRPEHFFEPLHGRIFERIVIQVDKQMVVTPVTLKPYFDADPAMAELGGTSYLARLTADGQGLLAPPSRSCPPS